MKACRIPSRLMIAGAVAAMLPLTAAIAQTPPAPPADAPQQEQPRQGATFESLDTNSDGRISKDEAAANKAVTEQFSLYDKNGDGFIEKSEVSSANTSSGEQPSQ
jgi:Ca2+-binding EF-hand superfamily protein